MEIKYNEMRDLTSLILKHQLFFSVGEHRNISISFTIKNGTIISVNCSKLFGKTQTKTMDNRIEFYVVSVSELIETLSALLVDYESVMTNNADTTKFETHIPMLTTNIMTLLENESSMQITFGLSTFKMEVFK